MVIINNKKYAKNEKEFTESLFQNNGTCVGFYKKVKGGIQLMNMQKELFAFIVNNKYNEQFFVSAKHLEDGKPYYMHGLSNADAEKLNITGMEYSEQVNLAKEICAIEAKLTKPARLIYNPLEAV